MDNGSEFISKRLENWAKKKQIDLLHIQLVKPAQNAYIERFNRTFREDVLDAYLFDDLDEVRLIAEHWLEDYNTIVRMRQYGAYRPASRNSKRLISSIYLWYINWVLDTPNAVHLSNAFPLSLTLFYDLGKLMELGILILDIPSSEQYNRN